MGAQRAAIPTGSVASQPHRITRLCYGEEEEDFDDDGDGNEVGIMMNITMIMMRMMRMMLFTSYRLQD